MIACVPHREIEESLQPKAAEMSLSCVYVPGACMKYEYKIENKWWRVMPCIMAWWGSFLVITIPLSPNRTIDNEKKCEFFLSFFIPTWPRPRPLTRHPTDFNILKKWMPHNCILMKTSWIHPNKGMVLLKTCQRMQKQGFFLSPLAY